MALSQKNCKAKEVYLNNEKSDIIPGITSICYYGNRM